MLNTFIRSLASEMSKHKAPWRYDDLKHSPWLYGSEYLTELALAAKSEEQLRDVMMHMVRHKTGDIESYKDVEVLCYQMQNKLRRESDD